MSSMWKCASVKTCFEKGSKASETKWNDCDTFCDEYLSPLQLLPVFIKRVQCQCLEVPQQQNGSHLSNECFPLLVAVGRTKEVGHDGAN